MLVIYKIRKVIHLMPVILAGFALSACTSSTVSSHWTCDLDYTDSEWCLDVEQADDVALTHLESRNNTEDGKLELVDEEVEEDKPFTIVSLFSGIVAGVTDTITGNNDTELGAPEQTSDEGSDAGRIKDEMAGEAAGESPDVPVATPVITVVSEEQPAQPDSRPSDEPAQNSSASAPATPQATPVPALSSANARQIQASHVRVPEVLGEVWIGPYEANGRFHAGSFVFIQISPPRWKLK